ncbi:hypothetical protein D9619_004653 [Psilocybe cf. subviscida]|uniref:Uncharacterized protein n=1 Tax=Psilocybe cf. subviscida TaxID=2480587 RepID=A0A8H5F8M1_9AGAR|nr:hypothetical protein D9619_004653 [Psilocybe cf. subviscida]
MLRPRTQLHVVKVCAFCTAEALLPLGKVNLCYAAVPRPCVRAFRDSGAEQYRFLIPFCAFLRLTTDNNMRGSGVYKDALGSLVTTSFFLRSHCFRIRSAANIADEPGLQVFVSKYTNENGSVAWYNIASNFNDVSTWNRNVGFETVVFRNQLGKTRAFYLQIIDGQFTEITFFGMNRDISTNYVKA